MAQVHIWICSTNEEKWTNGEEFDSREKALTYGLGLAGEEGTDTYWIGIKGEFTPHLDGSSICEVIQKQASDCAGEYAEDWPIATRLQEQELGERLTHILLQWIADTGNIPRFGTVTNVEQITTDTVTRIGG